MNIYPINSYIDSRKSLLRCTFKANERWIYGKNAEPLYKATTGMLRNDIRWRDYIDMLYLKYLPADKVNVLIQACSNGM